MPPDAMRARSGGGLAAAVFRTTTSGVTAENPTAPLALSGHATLVDTLAELANDGKWYSRTAIGAKLDGKRSVLAAISRLRRVTGYCVEKRRLTEHGNQWEYRITSGPSVPTA
jgi:hypothetical protein